MLSTLILSVDDNDSCRAALLGALSRLGFNAIAAENVGAGLELARERRRSDMILMALRMPEMDGWQALDALRGDPGDERHPGGRVHRERPRPRARRHRWLYRLPRQSPLALSSCWTSSRRTAPAPNGSRDSGVH